MRGSFYNFHLCPRYLLFLSDGQFCFHFAQLAPSLNNLIHSNQLARFTIVRVLSYMYSTGLHPVHPVIYIQELEESGTAMRNGSSKVKVLQVDQ